MMLLQIEVFSWGTIGVVGLLIAGLVFFILRLISNYDKRCEELQKENDCLRIEFNEFKEEYLKKEIQMTEARFKAELELRLGMKEIESLLREAKTTLLIKP